MEMPKIFPYYWVPFWNNLPDDDKSEYQILRENFKQQHMHSKGYSFQNVLRNLLAYIERKPENQEARCIVCGVFFGNSYLYVNTKQLKYLTGQCKSSINNGFHKLGYVSSKNKNKLCFIADLPTFINYPDLIRHWTVRRADTNVLPIKRLLMTSQQRPLLPTPQINRNTNRKALPIPLLISSPKEVEVEISIISPIVPKICCHS